MQIPEDIYIIIYKKLFSQTVLIELIDSYDFIWRNPSNSLIDLCDDIGTIQQGYHELEDMIIDENMWAYKSCIENQCENCSTYGFPCSNLAYYGFNNIKLECLWSANFHLKS